MDFLNISDKVEIHTIPKTWRKWISVLREKYGKTQTFQIYGFLQYFGWIRNPYNSQNMGKVDFHSTRKVRENTNIPKLWVSQIFWVTQKSMQFPKHGKSGFPLYGKSMGKHRDFPYSSLPRIFRVNENPCNSQCLGMCKFP